MKEIQVVDMYGSHIVRFLAQGEGTWLVISSGCGLSPTGRLNGLLLASWQQVTRELVALTVPASLKDRSLRARSSVTGQYADTELVYPLSASALARVVGVTEDEMRGEVSGLVPECSA